MNYFIFDEVAAKSDYLSFLEKNFLMNVQVFELDLKYFVVSLHV